MSAGFETVVRSAFAELGVQGELDADGQLQTKSGKDEVWLDLGPDGLSVRSRIYTFRRDPAPAVLSEIEARRRSEGDEIVYLEPKRSLYAAHRFDTPPSPRALLDGIEATCRVARRWLETVLPHLLER